MTCIRKNVLKQKTISEFLEQNIFLQKYILEIFLNLL